MHYLIFIPGSTVPNKKRLGDVGLSDHSQGAFMSPCPHGPMGLSGVLAFWQHSNLNGYFPSQQEWIASYEATSSDAGAYWVGLANNDLPQPNELIRNEVQEGSYVTLGDGKQWLIPAARLLPRDYVCRANGQWTGDVFEQFKGYWNESLKWFEAVLEWDLSGETKPCVDPIEAIKFITSALKLNYRVTPEVISRLRLLNSKNLASAIVATVSGLEIHGEMDREKKDSSQVAEV